MQKTESIDSMKMTDSAKIVRSTKTAKSVKTTRSTKSKFLAIGFLILLFLYAIIWIVLQLNLFMPLKEERNAYAKTYADRITQSIDSEKQIYEKMAQNLCYSTVFAEELTGKNLTPIAKWERIKSIQTMFQNNMAIMYPIQNITVYVQGSELWSDGRYVITDEFDEDYLNTGFLWTREITNADSSGFQVLCLYKKVLGLGKEVQAYIRIEVDGQKAFGSYMQSDQDTDMRAYLTDEDGKILATSQADHADEYLQDQEGIILPKDQLGKFTTKNGEVLIVQDVGSDWYTAVFLSAEYTDGKMKTTYMLIGGIMVAIAVITGVMMGSFLERIFVRINELSNRMSRIWDEKDLIEIRGECDEVQRLEKQYNKMIHRLDSTVEEMAKVRTQKQQFEIQALESQINPHFLYNTLGMMRWEALDAESDSLVSMIDNLAVFYRLSQNGGKGIISLKDELTLIDAYLTLQQERYGHCVEVEKTIDEKLLGWKIPKMILQPLVENVWLHGDITLPGHQHMWIEVSFTQDEKLCICVRDNGSGMDEARLQQVEQGRIEEGHGIGISYIKNILQYYYKDQYQYEIESKKGEGTCVTIFIPESL